MNPINPELVAAKLKSLREREGSASDVAEFTELVWFLQSVSLRSGGLAAFVYTLLAEFPEKFQTSAMIDAGTPTQSGRYTMEQCLVVWKSFSRVSDPFFNRFVHHCEPPSASQTQAMSFNEFLLYFVDEKTSPIDAKGMSTQAVALRSAFERFNYDWISQKVVSLAKDKLPSYLTDVCQQDSTHLSGQKYCPDLVGLLKDQIARSATAARAQLAETIVTKTIFRELEFAYSERVPVPIVGESRFGKTRSVEGWCNAFPGRARLVTVPDSSREIDFIRAHADAFGIDYTPATSAAVLKDKVEFVMRHSGLMAVYDEAHFLIPVSYHKTTPPRRLNWVRSKVIDQGVPCAFFATPQSYHQTLEKYVKTTGFRIEQWLGRMSPPIILSDVIPFEEIVAVARKHFPELSDVMLGEIADRAILSDGHLKNVELAGRRARFLARERQHPTPTKRDVLDAIDEMMPTSPRVISHQPEAPVAAPLPARSIQPAAAQRIAPVEEFSRRGTDAATLIQAPALVG